MTLRKRTLILVVATSTLAIIILYLVSRALLIDSFGRLEAANARENLDRLVNTVNNELAGLDSTSADWSNWDDTYYFLRDGTPGYVDANLTDTTYTNLKLNVIALVDRSGKIAYERAFDLENGTDLPIPGSLAQQLASGSPLTSLGDENRAITGIIMLDGTPALAAARPVLTNDATGPSTGTLVFARYLNAAKVAQLSDSVRLSITVNRYDAPDLPADFQATKAAFTGDTTEIIRPLNEKTVSGYALMHDVYGKPALIMRADMPRTIYAQGWNTITYLVAALVVVVLIMGVLNLGVLERFVVSRVARLSTDVANIRGDSSARVAVSGSDELTGLAKAINEMLESLAESQRTVRTSERQLQSIVNNAPVTLWALDKQGEIILLRGKELETLGFQRVSVGDKPDSGVYRNIRPLIERSREALQSGKESGALVKAEDRIFDTRYSPLYDDKGSANGVIGIATDITEQKQAETALHSALERVERQNHAIERVHEFFKGTLEQMTSTVQLGADRAELLDYLNTVQSEFDRLQAAEPKTPKA